MPKDLGFSTTVVMVDGLPYVFILGAAFQKGDGSVIECQEGEIVCLAAE